MIQLWAVGLKVAESSIDVNLFILMIYYLDIYIRYIIIYPFSHAGSAARVAIPYLGWEAQRRRAETLG
jgi:hypothetical protein